MNWDAIGAVGEIVGALAVLITLIYLAMQIRQNSNMQRAQTHQQLAHERTLNLRMIIANKELRDALLKWHLGNPLTGDERSILFWFSSIHLRTYENELYQHSKGMIEDAELEVQRILLENAGIEIEAIEAIALHSYTPEVQQVIREMAQKKRGAA